MLYQYRSTKDFEYSIIHRENDCILDIKTNNGKTLHLEHISIPYAKNIVDQLIANDYFFAPKKFRTKYNRMG